MIVLFRRCRTQTISETKMISIKKFTRIEVQPTLPNSTELYAKTNLIAVFTTTNHCEPSDNSNAF
jgi:hypothetical protein